MVPERGNEKRSDMISRGSQMVASVMIGRSGLSPGVLEDASAQLKKHRLIKVKIQGKMDRDAVRELAERVAGETGSELLQVKGRTFLLHRK